MGNDLTAVLDDDLARLETAVCTDSEAAVGRLEDLDTDVELVGSLGASSLEEIGKGTVLAVDWTDGAVTLITLVQHQAVVALLATSILLIARATRVVVDLVWSPVLLSIANEAVYMQVSHCSFH